MEEKIDYYYKKIINVYLTDKKNSDSMTESDIPNSNKEEIKRLLRELINLNRAHLLTDCFLFLLIDGNLLHLSDEYHTRYNYLYDAIHEMLVLLTKKSDIEIIHEIMELYVSSINANIWFCRKHLIMPLLNDLEKEIIEKTEQTKSVLSDNNELLDYETVILRRLINRACAISLYKKDKELFYNLLNEFCSDPNTIITNLILNSLVRIVPDDFNIDKSIKLVSFLVNYNSKNKREIR